MPRGNYRVALPSTGPRAPRARAFVTENPGQKALRGVVANVACRDHGQLKSGSSACPNIPIPRIMVDRARLFSMKYAAAVQNGSNRYPRSVFAPKNAAR